MEEVQKNLQKSKGFYKKDENLRWLDYKKRENVTNVWRFAYCFVANFKLVLTQQEHIISGNLKSLQIV